MRWLLLVACLVGCGDDELRGADWGGTGLIGLPTASFELSWSETRTDGVHVLTLDYDGTLTCDDVADREGAQGFEILFTPEAAAHPGHVAIGADARFWLGSQAFESGDIELTDVDGRLTGTFAAAHADAMVSGSFDATSCD